jgi:RIO kinase 2
MKNQGFYSTNCSYFNRDVNCIVSYFKRKYGIEFENIPKLEEDVIKIKDLDHEVKASGFVKKALGEKNITDLAIMVVLFNLKFEKEGYNVMEEREEDEREEEEKRMSEDEDGQILNSGSDEEEKIEKEGEFHSALESEEAYKELGLGDEEKEGDSKEDSCSGSEEEKVKKKEEKKTKKKKKEKEKEKVIDEDFIRREISKKYKKQTASQKVTHSEIHNYIF